MPKQGHKPRTKAFVAAHARGLGLGRGAYPQGKEIRINGWRAEFTVSTLVNMAGCSGLISAVEVRGPHGAGAGP